MIISFFFFEITSRWRPLAQQELGQNEGSSKGNSNANLSLIGNGVQYWHYRRHYYWREGFLFFWWNLVLLKFFIEHQPLPTLCCCCLFDPLPLCVCCHSGGPSPLLFPPKIVQYFRSLGRVGQSFGLDFWGIRKLGRNWWKLGPNFSLFGLF